MDENRAGWLLREVARLHGQMQRNQVAVCCDTTSTQCHILTELHRNGPLTMAELVRRLGIDKGWTSRTVEAMAQDRLLVKEPHPNDKRTVVVSLTDEGRAKADEVNETLNLQSGRVLIRIPAAEQPGVLEALEKLYEALRSEHAGEPIPVALEEEPS